MEEVCGQPNCFELIINGFARLIITLTERLSALPFADFRINLRLFHNKASQQAKPQRHNPDTVPPKLRALSTFIAHVIQIRVADDTVCDRAYAWYETLCRLNSLQPSKLITMDITIIVHIILCPNFGSFCWHSSLLFIKTVLAL